MSRRLLCISLSQRKAARKRSEANIFNGEDSNVLYGKIIFNLKVLRRMSMILGTFKIMIPLKKQGEVGKILTRMVERTRVESGCISCHFYKDVQDNSVFVLEETWLTNDDLERHLRSDDFRDLLLVAETSLQAPEIIFSDIIPGNGMEAIEKARNRGQ